MGDAPVQERPEDVLLDAYLASTGEKLASLTISPDSTVGELRLAASRAVAEAAAAAAAAGAKEAPSTRGTTGFRVIANGCILPDDVKLSSAGVLNIAPNAGLSGGTETAPVVEFLRCRPGQVATAGAGLVKVWCGNTGECVLTVEVQSNDENFCSLPPPPSTSPDGMRYLKITGCPTVKIHVVETDAVAVTLSGHEGIVRHATFSSDGLRVATTSEDGSARIWDARNGKCRWVLRGHEGDVLCAAFSPDGKKVVTGSSDATTRIWDVHTGKCLAKLMGHRWAVNSCAFSWDGVLVITGSDDRSAIIWKVDTGECARVLEGHKSPVTEVCFLE
eukprot:TRINITY_DN110262_c0_g1_i1.p1 TRINITY_DN110262_c0_g1~~TRINITY_DN110262_c0_g1_i1.p1  ORF type:complete len:346 (-),score=58.71 TRINITY_DN110262_c0_g1_i1:15-1010(-)